jgi:hypothetical protein
MRVQIDLLPQVVFLVLPYIMIDEGDRDDQGEVPLPVLIEDLEDFLFLIL